MILTVENLHSGYGRIPVLAGVGVLGDHPKDNQRKSRPRQDVKQI